MLLGFGDRLLNEVKKLALKDVKIKIYAPPERKYSTWIGGSILAGLNTFKKVRITILPFDLWLTRHNRCGSQRRSIRKTQMLFTRSSASSLCPDSLLLRLSCHAHIPSFYYFHALRIYPTCNLFWVHGMHRYGGSYPFDRDSKSA